MKSWLSAFKRNWKQRLLTGGHMALSKQNHWGMTTLALDFLDQLIAPLLKRQAIFTNLRDIVLDVQTKTIDELTSDLFRVQQVIEKRHYVDDRTGIVYINAAPKHAAQYLALANGRALQPTEAYSTFFKMAHQLSETMNDVLQTDIDNNDDWYDYYTRRYASVFDEAFEVMRMFAQLVGLDCPPSTAFTASVAPAKR